MKVRNKFFRRVLLQCCSQDASKLPSMATISVRITLLVSADRCLFVRAGGPAAGNLSEFLTQPRPILVKVCPIHGPGYIGIMGPASQPTWDRGMMAPEIECTRQRCDIQVQRLSAFLCVGSLPLEPTFASKTQFVMEFQMVLSSLTMPGRT